MESYEKQNTLYKNREIGPYKEHFLESTLKRSAERVPHTEVFPTNDRGNLLLFYTISKKKIRFFCFWSTVLSLGSTYISGTVLINTNFLTVINTKESLEL